VAELLVEYSNIREVRPGHRLDLCSLFSALGAKVLRCVKGQEYQEAEVEVDSPIEFRFDLELEVIYRGKIVRVSEYMLLIRDKETGAEVLNPESFEIRRGRFRVSYDTLMVVITV